MRGWCAGLEQVSGALTIPGNLVTFAWRSEITCPSSHKSLSVLLRLLSESKYYPEAERLEFQCPRGLWSQKEERCQCVQCYDRDTPSVGKLSMTVATSPKCHHAGWLFIMHPRDSPYPPGHLWVRELSSQAQLQEVQIHHGKDTISREWPFGGGVMIGLWISIKDNRNGHSLSGIQRVDYKSIHECRVLSCPSS